MKAPNLLSPCGAAEVSLTPTFVWTSVAGAEAYWLCLDPAGYNQDQGPGPSSATCSFTTEDAAAPVLVVDQAALDFGLVERGTTAERTLVLSNGGAAQLSGSVDALSGAYAITQGGGPFTLLADETHVVRVAFTPEALAPYADTLQVTHNAPGQASPWGVPLSGEGADLGLAAPVLTYPEAGTAGIETQPTLQWTGVAEAATSELQLTEDGQGFDPPTEYNVTGLDDALRAAGGAGYRGDVPLARAGLHRHVQHLERGHLHHHRQRHDAAAGRAARPAERELPQ